MLILIAVLVAFTLTNLILARTFRALMSVFTGLYCIWEEWERDQAVFLGRVLNSPTEVIFDWAVVQLLSTPWWCYMLGVIFLVTTVMVFRHRYRILLWVLVQVVLPLLHWYLYILGWLSILDYQIVHETKCRRRFHALRIRAARRNKEHTHGRAADQRRQGDEALDNLAKALKVQRYDVSTCKRTLERGIQGSHGLYGPKDLGLKARGNFFDFITQGDAVIDQPLIDPRNWTDWWYNTPVKDRLYTFVDVDYYADIEKFCRMGTTIAMYTFTPVSVAGNCTDGVYTTHVNGEVELKMMGGASYRHKLWDWDVDHIFVPTVLGGYTYLVERKSIPDDPNHSLVYLTPSGWILGTRFWVTERRLQRQDITRKGLSGRTYAVKRVMVQDFDPECPEGENVLSVIHYAEPGCFIGAWAPERGCAAASARLDPNKSTAGTAVQFMKLGMEKPDERNLSHVGGLFAAMLGDGLNPWDIHDSWRLVGDPDMLAVPDPLDYHYTPIVAGEEPVHGAPSMVVLGKPIIPGGAAPTKSLASDKACVAGRINQVRNKEAEVPAVFSKYRDEYLAFLIPEEGCCTPYSLDDVRVAQNKPNQKVRNDREWNTLYGNVTAASKAYIKSFQKTEAYGKVAEPRNICQLPTDSTLRVSTFTYSFSEVIMKKQPWYAFGHSPTEVGALVHALAKRWDFWANTDFSRFDGTLGEFLCTMEMLAFIRAYPAEYRHEIYLLFDNMTLVDGKSSFGIKFYLAWARLSGSGQTSIGNTMVNSFIAYCGYRAAGLEPSQAWATLGIYGGDDGLTPYVPGLDLEAIATMFGLKLKLEKVSTDHHTTFLGRLFFDPRNNPAHVADVTRALTKCNLSSLHGVSTLVGYYAKTSSWVVTDPETPVLRAITAAIQKEVDLLTASKTDVKHRKKIEEARRTNPGYLFAGYLEQPFLPPSAYGDARLFDAVCENLGVRGDTIDAIESYLLRTPRAKWDCEHFHAQFTVVPATIPAFLGPDQQVVGPPGKLEYADNFFGGKPKPLPQPMKKALRRREATVATALREKARQGAGKSKQRAPGVWAPKPAPGATV